MGKRIHSENTAPKIDPYLDERGSAFLKIKRLLRFYNKKLQINSKGPDSVTVMVT